MTTNYQDYLKILIEEIHSVVVATVDDNYKPVTRVIDMMLWDDEGVYFLTAKGKDFYKQIMDAKYLSLSGMTSGEGTMSRRSISLQGYVENIGTEKLEEIFEANSYMKTIYPSQDSRKALEVFRIYKGHGEYFDLSTKPITRANFAYGEDQIEEKGFYITSDCIGCGACLRDCPQSCIEAGVPYFIKQEHCLHCGNCYDVCPVDAVERRG